MPKQWLAFPKVIPVSGCIFREAEVYINIGLIKMCFIYMNLGYSNRAGSCFIIGRIIGCAVYRSSGNCRRTFPNTPYVAVLVNSCNKFIF